jgi:hypothetical protein
MRGSIERGPGALKNISQKGKNNVAKQTRQLLQNKVKQPNN